MKKLRSSIRLKSTHIAQPALMVVAKKDIVLKPEMAARMQPHFSNLTTREVSGGHWSLWQTPAALTLMSTWVPEGCGVG